MAMHAVLNTHKHNCQKFGAYNLNAQVCGTGFAHACGNCADYLGIVLHFDLLEIRQNPSVVPVILYLYLLHCPVPCKSNLWKTRIMRHKKHPAEMVVLQASSHWFAI